MPKGEFQRRGKNEERHKHTFLHYRPKLFAGSQGTISQKEAKHDGQWARQSEKKLEAIRKAIKIETVQVKWRSKGRKMPIETKT